MAAMNARVSCEVICGPLSDTASRIGRAGSSASRSSRSGVISSTRPSVVSARSKITATWVEVSSIDTRVSIHLRETRSTIANAHRRAAPKWVTSHAQIRFGSHTSQSGHARLGSRGRGGSDAMTSP